MLVSKMQWVRLVRRVVNISPLGEKAVLRRRLFTLKGSEKESRGPCSTAGYSEQDEKILQPLTHLLQVPGKQIRPKLIDSFNYWMKLPTDKVTEVKDVVQDLHNSTLLFDDIEDNSVLRRGIPVAHSVYGVASTISAANYLLLRGLKTAQSLNHPQAMKVCIEQVVEMCWGQGMEIYWRHNYKCPSMQEYQEIAKKKTGALFMLAMKLMQLFSENKADFTKLSDFLGLYYQIWNDYRNLCLREHSEDKGCYADITEGQFTFPIIHAMKSHPDDSQLIHILRQRCQDVELKKYCVELLEKFGSFSYTRDTLEELDAEARAEVAKLGGNPPLEAFLDELLTWKLWTVENNPEQ